MSLKSFFAKRMAQRAKNRIEAWSSQPVATQRKVFNRLIESAKNTNFGIDHGFEHIQSVADFQSKVPVRDYEELRTYVEASVNGVPNVLWPGKPLYFAKTSGTTSGAKFIPITKESMPEHINAAKNALFMFIADTGNSRFVDGKMIFLQGSPVLKEVQGINQGRLSGIVAHYVPKYLQQNRLPSWETNCIEDWETKVNTIVDETIDQDMRLISGIPSWVQMYFEKLVTKGGNLLAHCFQILNYSFLGALILHHIDPNSNNLLGEKSIALSYFPLAKGFSRFRIAKTAKTCYFF